ncbi:MAG: cob(I)yrinic acid a,c-diamide adenosyltransferase [Clostridiales bacterium]|nr:cob(I)yrinic acid a,c-diamide adenosyltransferase [Clostridiales bacterium]
MEKKSRNGCLQVYTGDGKGKSTAAFGLALRAAGQGLKTVIIQFMKNGSHYGEIGALARLSPEIAVFSYGGEKCIRLGEETPEDAALARAALRKAGEAMLSGIDILILDELSVAVHFGLLKEAEVLELLAARPPHLEIVVTGRKAPQSVIGLADLVTEMKEVKHPHQKGVGARCGIEF